MYNTIELSGAESRCLFTNGGGNYVRSNLCPHDVVQHGFGSSDAVVAVPLLFLLCDRAVGRGSTSAIETNAAALLLLAVNRATCLIRGARRVVCARATAVGGMRGFDVSSSNATSTGRTWGVVMH
jgi:hypothetical protein